MSGHNLSTGNPCGIAREGTFSGQEIHVWECCLAVDHVALARYHALLSQDEQRRAARFRFERERRRYTAGRGMLREILAGYLDRDPGCLGLCAGRLGKPRLAPHPHDADIRFSLSRSRDLALVAVAVGVEVGVDLEYMDPDMGVSAIARGYFSASEHGRLASLPPGRQREAFFRSWTRKEAFLKGKGVGLLQDPAAPRVTLLPGEPAALPDVCSVSRETEGWTLFDLPAAPGYSASLAVQTPGLRIVCRKWGGAPGEKVNGPLHSPP